MSIKPTRALILAGALLVLAAVNYSIYAKEQIKHTGATIFLELAPVDPRSLMQGDYMALRFQLANAIEASQPSAPPTGALIAPVAVDQRRVATLAAENGLGEFFIRYRVRAGRVWLGTNAYFFEEGDASRFATAHYGEFKVDRASGEAVLVALRDKEMRVL